MDRLEQILDLNKQGKNRNKIKELLGYKRIDSLTRYMKKHNYTYNVATAKYIQIENEAPTEILSTIDSSSNTKVIQENLVALASKYTDIEDMLKWYRANKEKGNSEYYSSNTLVSATITEGLQIEHGEYTEAMRTSIKINKSTWEEFDKFCKEHSQFKKQDLHSKALEEFMQKYKE